MDGEAISADAVWQDMQTRGVEFVFAQFVDMYARPSAKLVPVDSREAFDSLLEVAGGPAWDEVGWTQLRGQVAGCLLYTSDAADE